ncbi:MAG: hypothetical protein H0X28_01315 [Solirubrobacterales bacterium]|nr:hypothetical protein [Solirubrobacterales bacterium]
MAAADRREAEVPSVVNFIVLWIAAPILDRPSQSDIVLLLAERRRPG